MKRPCILSLALLAAVLPVRAQPAPAVPLEQLQKLESLADQVKGALQRGDLDTANRLASDLMLGIFKQRQALTPTPDARLAKLEQSLPPGGTQRFYALADVAKAAFNAGEMNKAEQYARELLSLAAQYPKDWNYGNAIFFGNMIVGRVALRRDKNVPLAKSSLLDAGRTTGSPQLDSFGPNMSLAKDLMEAGERDTVIEFFNLCRAFWKMDRGNLDAWTATVKGGGMPEFGANLLY